jgi:hypothetical protein
MTISLRSLFSVEYRVFQAWHMPGHVQAGAAAKIY